MNSDSNLTFFEHLEELRRRLWVCAIFFVAAFVAAFIFSDQILIFLANPMRPLMSEFYFFSPAEGLVIKMKAALLLATLLASPVIAAQGWLFIKPALLPHEQKILAPFLCVISALFVGGAIFCFNVVLPPALQFLIGAQNELLKPMISFSEYLDFIFGMLLAFGVAFNLPVFLIGLSAAGILNAKVLNKFRKHAIFAIFIAAAVLTPGPDIASQILLAVPLLVLYEIGVAGSWVAGSMRKRSS